MPSVSVTDGSNKIFIIFPKLMLDTNESMSIFLSSFDRKIIPEKGVNDEVIKLAERNGSLIVETITLLKLFEQYLLGEKNRDECIDSLVNNTGLLNCD